MSPVQEMVPKCLIDYTFCYWLDRPQPQEPFFHTVKVELTNIPKVGAFRLTEPFIKPADRL